MTEKIKEQEEFEKVCRPVMQYLAKFHPHTEIIITNNNAERVEGVEAFHDDQYVPD